MISETIQKPTINPWVIALTVTLATFMELLDTSIANVALPYIGGGLGRSYDEVTWVLTTYLVANAVILPMSAWLSRAFGRKNYYLASVALFTVMSLLCGLAPSLGAMLLFRILQGIAGGGLAPVAQAVLIDTFPPAKRASAFALYTVVLVTAPAVGPVLGGWITDNYDWRWIFFINVPVGILSMYLSSRLIHDPIAFAKERATVRVNNDPKGRLTIDGLGIALIVISSGALEVALDRGQIDDWFGSAFICWMIGIAIFGWLATVLWELYTKSPVIDFRMLTNRNMGLGCALLFLFSIGLFGTTVLIPQLLQSLYAYRATDAGLVLGPGAVAITILAPISAQLVQRGIVKPKYMLLGSITIVTTALWCYSIMTLDADKGHYVFARVVQGVGYGFFFVPVNVIAFSMLRPDQNNRASSLTNFFRNWGGSFGIAMVTTIGERRTSYHQHQLASTITPSNAQLQQTIHQFTAYFFQHGFAGVNAIRAAYAFAYQQLGIQSSFLALMDCFRAIAVATLFCYPLALLVKRVKPPADSSNEPVH